MDERTRRHEVQQRYTLFTRQVHRHIAATYESIKGHKITRWPVSHETDIRALDQSRRLTSETETTLAGREGGHHAAIESNLIKSKILQLDGNGANVNSCLFHVVSDPEGGSEQRNITHHAY